MEDSDPQHMHGGFLNLLNIHLMGSNLLCLWFFVSSTKTLHETVYIIYNIEHFYVHRLDSVGCAFYQIIH